jgi:hypothetical protein
MRKQREVSPQITVERRFKRNRNPVGLKVDHKSEWNPYAKVIPPTKE